MPGQENSRQGREQTLSGNADSWITSRHLTSDIADRFALLRKRLGKDIRSISEVYLNSTPRSLVYRPIGHLDISQILAGRRRILGTHKKKLAGVEVVLEEVRGHDSRNARRTGSFRAVEWYTPEFERTAMPLEVGRRKDTLDQDSGWLRGGPR